MEKVLEEGDKVGEWFAGLEWKDLGAKKGKMGENRRIKT